MKAYRDWSIFAKIMGLSLATWLVLVIAAYTLLVPFIRGLIMDEKKAATSFLVQQATSMLVSYQKQIESGALTKEEAQKRAAERIASIRYEDGANYLWINDLVPKMVMHPLKPELNGTDLTGNKDPNGKALVCRNGQGQQRQGQGVCRIRLAEGRQKRSRPQALLRGTVSALGLDQSAPVFTLMMWTPMSGRSRSVSAIALLAILGLTVLLAWLVARSVTVPIHEIVESIKDIAQGEGDLTKRLPIHGKNEVGELSEWFNTFVGKLHGIIAQVSDNALQLASAATELQSTSKEMTESVNQLSSQSTTLATAGEEMAATSNDIAGNCHLAADGAQHGGRYHPAGLRGGHAHG